MVLVPCCDIRCDFRINKKNMLSSFFCLRLFVGGFKFYLRYLCLFCVYWFPTHIDYVSNMVGVV